MTAPRFIVEGAYHLVTRCCLEQRFFLKPCAGTNLAVRYCLARAAQKTGVQLLFAAFLSSHFHLGAYDPHGALPKFMQELDRELAKHQNAMWGRTDTIWDNRPYGDQILATVDDLLREAAYVIGNPVKHNLVSRARQWPGFVSLPEQLGATEVVERPRHYFRKDGVCPETIELTFHVPPCFHGTVEEWRALVAQRVLEFEEDRGRERAVDGQKVLGSEGVRRQSFNERPAKLRAPFQRRPTVIATDKSLRDRLKSMISRFRGEHRDCMLDWCGGNRSREFPMGTYLMRVLHRARVTVMSGGFEGLMAQEPAPS